MGYNNENSDVLILDIETLARPDFQPEPVSAPSNYKDEVKIAEYVSNNIKTQTERAALDIYGNQIIGIGAWMPSLGVSVVTCKTPKEERVALAGLAVLIDNFGHRRRVLTFNGINFDIPNAITRALKHELQFPLHLSDYLSKYQHQQDDLMELLTFGGRFAKRSLDFYCDFFGIDPPAPDGVKQIKGADIAGLVKEGKWDLVAEHCRHDVTKTMLLAKRLDVIHDDGPAVLPFPAAEEDVALF